MKKRTSLLLFLALALGCSIFASAVWTRQNASAGGGYIPGTPIGGRCESAGSWWENVARYRYSGYSCSHAGMGWIEFKVDKNWVADGKALHYYPIKTNAGSPIDVPTECAETEFFYHYGFLNYFEGYSDSYEGTYIESTGFSNSGSPKRKVEPGARLNTYVDWINSGDYAPVDHRFYIDGVQYAHATRAVYDHTDNPEDPETAQHKYEVAKEKLGWSDEFDEISIFCYDPEWENAVEAKYSGEVQVFVNGSVVSGGVYNAGSGVSSVTVSFAHIMKREPGADFETTSEWDIHPNNTGAGAATHTGSFNGNIGQSWNVQTTTKTVTLGETAVTVCSSIKFDNIVTKATDGAVTRTHNGLAQKCIIITPTPTPPTGVCPSARYSGTSKSKFTMNFNSQSYSNNYSTTNWSKTVWGKPGDNLQYIYELCGGADKPIEYGPYNTLPTLGSPHKATFKITGESTNGLSGYLFGNDIPAGSSASLTTGSAGFSNYMRTIKSPSIDSYGCDLIGAPNKPSYYQIRANVSCGSSIVIASSDVGTTIKQSLKYRYVVMEMYEECWPTLYGCYPVYGTKVSGGHNGANEITAEGSVKIPYNYALVPYMKHTDSDGVTYAGTSFSATAYISTLGRINKQVQNEKYATHTKNTTIRVVSFTTTGTPSQATQFVNDSNMTDNAVCQKAGGTANCKSLVTKTTILNKERAQLSGATDEARMIDNGGANVAGVISASVPLVDVGTRFCIAVGVYPADSHNTGNNGTIDDSSQTAAFSGSGRGWKVSAPACVTVAKKPSFSTEGGDLKTKGSVKTSRSTVNSRMFGSWSEYGLVAKGEVEGMASGAAFAYTKPIYTSRSQSIAGTMVPGSRQWVCKPVHWGFLSWQDCQWVYTQAQYNGGVINMASSDSGIAQGHASECALSSQTYGNADCNHDAVGLGTGIIDSTDLDAVARKVYQKYHMSANEMQSLFRSTRGASGLLNIAASREINGVDVTAPQSYTGTTDKFYLYRNYGSAACVYSSEFGKYIQGAPAENQRAKFTFEGTNYNNSAPQFCNAQGMKVWRAYSSSGDANVVFSNYPSNGAVYMGGAGTSDLGMTGSATTYRNPTYIFDIDGTFVIDEDMISSNSFINGEINDNYSSLDELPTVVIFAKNIIITNRVTRLDAWLIAGINGGEGLINTCGAVYDGSSLKFIHPENSTYNNELDADTCNNELVINGYVYAKKAILNRTYGGGSDNLGKFVQRGEVFNLRADAFYWSFYQSQRNRILTTVYSRELPTRY